MSRMSLLSTYVFVVAAAVIAAAQTSNNRPMDPFRIADNLYYVGTSDIGAYLITSPAGHVLIDAGYPETASTIRAHIASLGFSVKDVRLLLNTQAHYDHAGGFAELKQASGAKLMVMDEDASLVESGGHGDFNFGDKYPFPPARVDRRLKDGEQVRVGDRILTAHRTAGHTKGCTTWTFDVHDRGHLYHVVDMCGLSILDGTRVSGMPGYPSITEDYKRSFEILKTLPCDIFLGAHAGYFNGVAKAQAIHDNPEAANPFVDPAGFRAYVQRSEHQFLELLARER